MIYLILLSFSTLCLHPSTNTRHSVFHIEIIPPFAGRYHLHHESTRNNWSYGPQNHLDILLGALEEFLLLIFLRGGAHLKANTKRANYMNWIFCHVLLWQNNSWTYLVGDDGKITIVGKVSHPGVGLSFGILRTLGGWLRATSFLSACRCSCRRCVASMV